MCILPDETLETMPGSKGTMTTSSVAKARQLMPYYSWSVQAQITSRVPDTHLVKVNAFGIVQGRDVVSLPFDHPVVTEEYPYSRVSTVYTETDQILSCREPAIGAINRAYAERKLSRVSADLMMIQGHLFRSAPSRRVSLELRLTLPIRQ